MSHRRVLNKCNTGRPTVCTTAGTNIHELSDRRDEDVLFITLWNTDSSNDRWALITYNGVAVKTTVPAGDFKEVPAFAIRGQADDGTEVVNKNVFVTAEANSYIHVTGWFQR